MRIIRDLWTTSPRRTALLGFLLLLAAAAQAGGAALAGPVLTTRSPALFVVLCGALVTAAACDLGIRLLVAVLSAIWAADVRRRLCRVCFGRDLPSMENTPVGELLDRIDADVDQVATELRGPGTLVVQSAVTAALSTVAGLVVWWPAGVAMLLLVALLTRTLRRPMARIAPGRVAEEEAWSDMAAVMEEAIHGQDDVRTSLARPYVVRLFARRTQEVLIRGRRVWRLSGLVAASAAVATRSCVAALVVAGAVALHTGAVGPGRLTAVWLLALAFGGTVDQIGQLVPQVQYVLGAWERIQQLADSAQEPTGGSMPTPGELTVKDLTFAYPSGGGAADTQAADIQADGAQADGAPAPVLRGVTLTFRPGRSYALIGRSGSGKSTLAKILTRAVDTPRGAVRLAGVDLVDLDLQALRRWIAVVPQRTDLVAGTLADNITLFDPDLRPRVAEAIDQLGLSGWIGELPDGLDTRIGEGGHVLSAGQEQLVAFARILVRDPQIVILDEATARLDPVTEARVQRATDRLLQGRIGILIAHRLSSVRHCDEVVIMSAGRVVEAQTLARSRRFAELLAHAGTTARAEVRPATVRVSPGPGTAPSRTTPPPLPRPAPPRPLRELVHLAGNDRRYGLVSVGVFVLFALLGLDGALLSWTWADLVDGAGGLLAPTGLIVAMLLLAAPLPYLINIWYPEWWVRQMLRIDLRLVYGQTGHSRVSAHTPAEVVAQTGDVERVVELTDNVVDQVVCVAYLISMTLVSATVVPALFFAGTMVASGMAALGMAARLGRAARRSVAARASFATALVSCLSAVRTVKLSGATPSVLAHLADLDRIRSLHRQREIIILVWARSAPVVVGGLLPVGAWAMYLAGSLSAGATLVAVATLGAARWFSWSTASLVSQYPSARVWTERSLAMSGSRSYSAPVPGVDLSEGTAPAPETPARQPLRTLRLSRFSAVHEDGTVGVRDVDLSVRRGQLVLVVGPVASGKSSLLRALAGIVHHTGELQWNGERVTAPEAFLRPNQVGYVAQVPRVLSGTIADNIALGHAVDAEAAASTAQLDRDLAATEHGLTTLIGHKGTRLSGGQLQRVALARALAPGTELLVADDVSSALDIATELDLWRTLRGHGLTVVGSTSKVAALAQADQVLVLEYGRVAAQGRWTDLSARWGHLAG